MKLLELLTAPILPESVKTWDGYNDWPPVWVVILGFIFIYIITRKGKDL